MAASVFNVGAAVDGAEAMWIIVQAIPERALAKRPRAQVMCNIPSAPNYWIVR